MDSILNKDESMQDLGDSKFHERVHHSRAESKDHSLGFGKLDEEEQLD